jgi:hypothetical protein
MPTNSTPSAPVANPGPLTGKRVDHRDGAGHLDPAYAARLRERTSRRARRDQDREVVGEAWDGDPVAEKSAQEFVMTVTSGEGAGSAMLGAVMPEENGGPFVETYAGTEFAYGPDRSNPTESSREPFPKS